jgi:hypothetical protein
MRGSDSQLSPTITTQTIPVIKAFIADADVVESIRTKAMNVATGDQIEVDNPQRNARKTIHFQKGTASSSCTLAVLA